MRFTLGHPTDPSVRAEYGFDPIPGVGFFVDVFHGTGDEKPTITYSALDSTYDRRSPLRGALEFLTQEGFYTLAALHEALRRTEQMLPEHMPRRVRRVAEVVWNFKQAAD